MRVSSLALAVSLAVVSISTSLQSQPAEAAIDARSQSLVVEARAARAAGHLDDATDDLETALAADPRNLAALTMLGEVSQARGLPGKAIHYYREALVLSPNDLGALAGQGEALVAKGALVRARDNLAKLKGLCRPGCAEETALAAAIAKGPPIATAQVVKPATAAKE